MKVISWIIALCGLWEFGDIAAVFVPGFGQIPAFLWNHILVGLILIIAGTGAALTRNSVTAQRLHWAAVGAGAWLVIATFILRNPSITIGLWNDIIIGGLVFILGAWAARAERRAAG